MVFPLLTDLSLCRGRGELSNAFSALVMDMWLGDSVYIFPDEVKRVLGKMHASFSDGTQQDAQELLLFFLNVLQNDLKRVSAGGMYAVDSTEGRGHLH